MHVDCFLFAKRMLVAGCLVALSSLLLVQSAPALPVYNIVSLGFDDLEHTRNDGYRYSDVDVGYKMNEAGQVSGSSHRFDGGGVQLGQTAWLDDGTTTINIGLTGPEHTKSDGTKYNSAGTPNEAGLVGGSSRRYNGGDSDLGRSAWLYDGATTIALGFTGSEHTRTDGFKFSGGGGINEAGQASGYSSRFSVSGTDLGRSAWLYASATTIEIGFTDSEHTSSSGYKFSGPVHLNQAGNVLGVSYRYNLGSADLGQSAWLYDGATTINIGLTGGEHTRSGGDKRSYAFQLNEAGHVLGVSDRYYGGNTDFGRSVWIYNGATTIDIGLTGSEHTRDDGYKLSGTFQLNEAGQVRGYSERYNGSNTNLGQSAWLFNGTTTIDVGLTGADHTRSNGSKTSEAEHLNEAGQVSGYSIRYNGGSTYMGRSAWLYDGATTIEIGLTGSEHTGADGYKFSRTFQLNEAGQARGYSERYNGSNTALGASAWFYDGSTTIDIGLTGPEHTRNDGYKFSEGVYFGILNEAGQVSGFSHRYNGGSTPLGQDAWLFDPVLGQTIALQLSTRSDGYAYSFVDYLGDDGLVLGTYTLFDALDNDLGKRAFYFTLADGLHDLGSLADGGLAANDWDLLASALSTNGLGQIIGHGKLASQSGGQMAYLLTPETSLPGDYNQNGIVDAADYTVWRDTMNDLPRYNEWRANFGSMAGAGSGAAGALPSHALVPEPTSLVLLTLSAPAIVSLRRRGLRELK